MKKKIVSFLLVFSILSALLGCVSAGAADTTYILENGLKYVKYSTYCKITGYVGEGSEVVIPATIGGLPVTTIGDYAFCDYCDFWGRSITAGANVNANTAFDNPDVPDGEIDIEDSIFTCTEHVTKIVIPDTVTRIGSYAFHGCTGISYIDIPAGVVSIGEYAFYNCMSLNTVYYYNTISAWNSISFGSYNNSLTSANLILVKAPDFDKVIKAKTMVSDYISSLGSDFDCVVNKGDTVVSEDRYVGTGMIVTATHKASSKIFTKVLVIRGDVSGDGEVKVVDYMKMKRSISNTSLLAGSYFEAADLNGDGVIRSNDYMKVKSYFSGNYNLYA